MKVAMYLRKSRTDDHSLTVQEVLRRHRETLFDFANTHNLVVIDVYEEVASGDSLFVRPRMMELLAAVEERRYNGVLCMDIDRLGRGGMRDQGLILDTLKYSETAIVTPESTYDLNVESDEEITEFKTFFSRREYKTINKRLRRGILKTVNDGCYIANAPYGYRKTRVDKKPTLEIMEDEAYFVRMIYDLYAQGIGTTSIASTLNALGSKPHRAAEWGRGSVGNILKNPTYCGKIAWYRMRHYQKGYMGSDHRRVVPQTEDQWVVVDGIHPTIITEELWNRAQETLKGRYIPSHKDGTVKNPLAGLVVCNHCGSHMQRQGSTRNMPYLLCTTPGCMPGSQLSLVEDAVICQLRKSLEKIHLNLPNEKKPDVSGIEKAIVAIRKQIGVAQSQKAKLHDLLEQGVYDVETFHRRMNALLEKIQGLETQCGERERELKSVRAQDNSAVARTLESVLEAYDVSDAAVRNKLLRSVIDQIVYDKAKRYPSDGFTLIIELKHF